MTNFKSYLPGNPKLFRLLALIIAFCLPLTKKGIPLLIAMLVLLRIWQYFAGDKGAIRAQKELKIFSALCLSYYALHLIGMLWTSNFEAGMDELEYKLSFLILPLLFIFRKPYKDNLVRLLSLSYVSGMILFGLIAIIRAAFRYDDIGITAWFYSELSGNFHTSYVALYACWAVALLAEMWQMKSDKNWYYWLATAFLLFFVVLLASKAGFLAAILTVCLVAIYLFKNKFTSIRYWLFTLSAALVLLLGSIYSPSLNQRLAAAGASVALNNENDNPITQSDTTSVSQGSTNLRLAAMEAGFNYFIKNPFGAGTGDLDLAMAEEYKFMNQKEAGEKQLNPHNQYLSTAVALGWPGFLLILAIVFYPAWIFFKRKKLIWLILPLITAFNLLFESMLEQQAGIVFFIFWSILLLADIEEHSVQT